MAAADELGLSFPDSDDAADGEQASDTEEEDDLLMSATDARMKAMKAMTF